jgi:hypothetical protein
MNCPRPRTSWQPRTEIGQYWDDPPSLKLGRCLPKLDPTCRQIDLLPSQLPNLFVSNAAEGPDCDQVSDRLGALTKICRLSRLASK